MLLEINNLKYSLQETKKNNEKVDEQTILYNLVCKKLKIIKHQIDKLTILKKSVDARKKEQIYLVYSVLIEIKGTIVNSKILSQENVVERHSVTGEQLHCGSIRSSNRPIIIGSGPAGLFAGLILAENGYKPIILERGQDVDTRSKSIDKFFKKGYFDKNGNIQFGEGGAGTFSDGKLTTRIKDKRCEVVLSRLVEAGAPEEIKFLSKPHIGTDILKLVVKNIRNRIIQLGGDVRFVSKVTDLKIGKGEVEAVEINHKQKIKANIVILALGHSARDTYEMLYNRGVEIIQKPFSMGVRVEHLQSFIDNVQYGKFAGNYLLGPADYILTYRSKTTGRSAYSFCMCPGGMVVSASSEEGMIVTNGMSEYKRNRANANSAIVVSVGPEDFGSEYPLAGVDFQRKWERAAYITGGSNYNAPVQLIKDFLNGEASKELGRVKPSYEPGTTFADLTECLPEYIVITLKEALNEFNRRIKGFSTEDGVITGIETRTSAPVRIVRNADFESISLKNLYPAGEGAGYAGGIISAAVDGIKVAEKIIEKFKPIEN